MASKSLHDLNEEMEVNTECNLNEDLELLDDQLLDNDPSLCQPGNEHTGRWTRAEHETFLEGLKKYGKVIHNL